ncbi:hypothetical protein [Lacticaseibacillus jixiensis]|uniref:hypothetical protein n=1 Tax=Lacticaseibacillus jixiensis TaxID=3231926 RepID=UPI0036F29FC8
MSAIIKRRLIIGTWLTTVLSAIGGLVLVLTGHREFGFTVIIVGFVAMLITLQLRKAA